WWFRLLTIATGRREVTGTAGRSHRARLGCRAQLPPASAPAVQRGTGGCNTGRLHSWRGPLNFQAFELAPGTHLCAMCRGVAQRDEVLGPYVSEGLSDMSPSAPRRARQGLEKTCE